MKVFDWCRSIISFIIEYIRWKGSLKFDPNYEVFFPTWNVINTMNMDYKAWVKRRNKEEKRKGKLTEECPKLKDVS